MITVEFGPTPSTAHARAVALARQAQPYTLDGTWHRAEYSTTRAGLVGALELWAIVRTWRTSRLYVDGTAILPHERYPMLEVLHCAARATEFDPPARYCRSFDPAPHQPPIPCRHWMSRWAYLLDRIDWDQPGRADSLRALLSEFSVSRCPFLDTRNLQRDLAEWRTLTGEQAPPSRVDQLLDEIIRHQNLKRQDGAA